MKYRSLKSIENFIPKKGSFKHMLRKIEEDGRIVKGVNTTADVGTNEIPKQAAKFGNKVDKDGRPPTLSKKVKGKSTNVMFNLGMTESVDERSLTKGEEKKKEKYVKGMKKAKGDFKDRYGKDAEAVMYATATKMAKKSNEGKMIPNPKNSFITKADTAYDFIKLGTNMANLKSMPTGVSNVDEPDIMIAPYAGKKEMKYLKKELKRLGYDVQDADGYQDAHYDEKPTGGKEPPQVKNEGRLGKIKLSKLRPVHKKRKFKKLFNQLKRIGEDNLSPITIDKHGHIVNGHHRYDALRLIGSEYAPVRMLDVHVAETLEEGWSKKYKDSINCSNPKGFSQKAHCAGKKKTNEIKVDKPDPDMLQYVMLEAKVGELSEATEIYVDMDGVLADFFGEWAKIMKVDHYSKIDNVDINDALQKIRDTDEFWLKLPLLPQAKSLLALIKKVKGSYNICSSPLADDPRSEPHKREWIKKNLSFFPPKQVIITTNKSKYATQADGTPNILIDDFGKNVNAWEAAGGEGFKYKDHKFERTAKELQKHMNEPVEENEGIADKLSSFADKILGKMEKWWNKQVDAHEMAWAEVEKILKPYAEELRDLIKDSNDFGMLMLLIKHNQGKKPLLDKMFAKIRQFGIKAVYKMQGLENKLATENFADGKKKGKSRPGRVKKAGASCNGSVTSLRTKAKKYSGEKAKMYHWCANMKSGRKKSK